ncbi:TPA: hypothetical protein TVK16_000748 [Streptococcus equi subsp. zooepidemicus]|nr:hypothetical protein [Streptococcus equi subsp. zooepidemicus]
MGRDKSIDLLYLVTVISIHSPVWGETVLGRQDYQWQHISIHSPAKGETAQYSTVYREMTQAS